MYIIRPERKNKIHHSEHTYVVQIAFSPRDIAISIVHALCDSLHMFAVLKKISRFWSTGIDGQIYVSSCNDMSATQLNRYKDIWIIHILLNGVTPELSLEPPAGVGVWPLQSGGAMVGGCFEGPG